MLEGSKDTEQMKTICFWRKPLFFRGGFFIWEIKSATERANPGKYTDGIFSGIQKRNQYGLIHCGLDYSTVLVSVPIPSISQTTVSPHSRKQGGCIPMPTPAGVPVAITVPALSVIPWLSSAIIWEMLVMN